MDVYQAAYPTGTCVDNMELETLSLSIEWRYHLDLTAVWQEQITLGTLYEYTTMRLGES